MGLHESSDKAMKIMKITTAMVVMLIVWCLITILKRGAGLPPLPSVATMKLDHESLGWLTGSWLPQVTFIALLVGFGHSVLAMSGEETLAQVNREIESPKLKNLERTGLVIFVYSLLFTSLVSFFAVMLIPDAARPGFFANLIGGLAMYVVGPLPLRLAFHLFVVLVGVLILSGAVNTAIIGANGVLNRVADDGVLTDWFQRPHKRYGTTYRIINLIVGLQVLTIVISRGNVYLLAALYAFGVIWSFAFKALAVLVLRYTEPENRQWKVPLNFHIGGREIPIGLGLITVVLFLVAAVNLFTKQDATIAGVTFTALFFLVFTLSERYTHRQKKGLEEQVEQFRVFGNTQLDYSVLSVRPGNILVAIRDPRNLYYLRQVLHETDTTKQNVVVMTARLYQREHSFSGHTQFEAKDVFDTYEQELFTRVVSVAETEGKPVSLLVVPGNNVFDAIVLAAQRLQSARMVAGLSNKLTADEQGKLTGDAWERLPEPKPRLLLQIYAPDGKVNDYDLGPHEPRLRPEDVKLLHDLWLELTQDPAYRGLHHYDVMALALRELQQELKSGKREALLSALRQEASRRPPPPPS